MFQDLTADPTVLRELAGQQPTRSSMTQTPGLPTSPSDHPPSALSATSPAEQTVGTAYARTDPPCKGELAVPGSGEETVRLPCPWASPLSPLNLPLGHPANKHSYSFKSHSLHLV